MNRLQGGAVVRVHHVEQLALHGHVTRNALHTDREFEPFAGVQPSFNFGDNNISIFIDAIQRQAVCVEKKTNLGTGEQQVLRDFFSVVNMCRDLLKLPKKQGFKGGTALNSRSLVQTQKTRSP